MELSEFQVYGLGLPCTPLKTLTAQILMSNQEVSIQKGRGGDDGPQKTMIIFMGTPKTTGNPHIV